MKKIINGKMYDPDTAKCVACWENEFTPDCCADDAQYVEEVLYRMTTGEYFLYGSGGAWTKYAECYGGETYSGEDITPLSEGEAREWAKNHFDRDKYEELFGAVTERSALSARCGRKDTKETKYIIWDQRENGQVFTEEYDHKEDAIHDADYLWERCITDEEKRHIASFYVTESENPDKDAVNHYDGNDVKRYK